MKQKGSGTVTFKADMPGGVGEAQRRVLQTRRREKAALINQRELATPRVATPASISATEGKLKAMRTDSSPPPAG